MQIIERDVNNEDSGHISIDTSHGAHIISDAILDALYRRDLEREHKDIKRRKKDEDDEIRAYKEPKANIRHLLELVPQRNAPQLKLNQTRKARPKR